eukprot:scaffold94261_cov64-Phaeocystis_antarctica.AAC.3
MCESLSVWRALSEPTTNAARGADDARGYSYCAIVYECSRRDACQFGPFACPLHPISARPGPTRPLTCGGAKESAGEHA